MSFEVKHSDYSLYIEKTLNEEYSHIECFRDTDNAKIDLYQNIKTGNKIVCIFSKIPNYDVFRILRGKEYKNIPKIFDVCACENCICILEEFIDGKTLADALKYEKFSVKKSVKYVLDICSALKLLHEHKIVHRDIKPENIVITPDDRVVLIDLQSTRITADCEKKDTVNLGTVGYAAPEQYGISPSMPTTDIYALGVLLNEMILGVHPTINTPKGRLGKIIKKCTSTQISDRYESVEKLGKVLKRYTLSVRWKKSPNAVIHLFPKHRNL